MGFVENKHLNLMLDRRLYAMETVRNTDVTGLTLSK